MGKQTYQPKASKLLMANRNYSFIANILINRPIALIHDSHTDARSRQDSSASSAKKIRPQEKKLAANHNSEI
jgi:hypothetical protein